MARCPECRKLVVEIARVGKSDTEIETPATPHFGPPAASGTEGSVVELRRGAQIGRYTLLYPLGEGGMGSVYAAFDPKLDRRVALKFLRTDLLGLPRQGHRDRLVREARALARLSHANVVSIYDVAESKGSIYIAMELIDGNNARVWRELGNRSPEEIVKVYREALSALEAAHAQGIIHRDFKPDNVMVGADAIARVTDFGLARAAAVDVDELLAAAAAQGVNWETLTQTGLVLGTPRYMAPEQFSGVANEGTDQFSLCLSLYEALYGHYPLGTKTPRDLEPSKSVGEQLLAPLGRDNISDSLRRTLLRGMAVLPGDRWPSLAELDYELRQALSPRYNKQRWALAASLLAFIAGAAFVLAPSPPPSVSVRGDLDGYAAELEKLRAEVEQQRSSDEQLARSLQRIERLEMALSDREREIALIQLAEEGPKTKPRRSMAIPPLPGHSVERSVTTRLAEVLACYEDSVRGDDEETVSVKVGISANGSVKWVAKPYQGSRGAGTCLKTALSRLTFPAGDTATTATLTLSFFRLPETGLLAVSMRAATRSASLGQVTVDASGRVLVDCQPSDPLCGL